MNWINKLKNTVNKDIKYETEKKASEIFDILNVKKFKGEIATLKAENNTLKEAFTDIDKMTAFQLTEDIIKKRKLNSGNS